MIFSKLHGIHLKKCNYMCIGRKPEDEKFEFDILCLEYNKEEVVLDVTIVNKWTFGSHLKNISWKAGQNFCALLGITNYLNSSQKKLFLVAWQNLSSVTALKSNLDVVFKETNNLVNRIHERSIQIISGDNQTNFKNIF